MIDFIDSNWVSTILSISFTIVIFIIGIPVVLMQTYIPENLRVDYMGSELYKEKEREIKFLSWLVLVLAVLFANQNFLFLTKKITSKVFGESAVVFAEILEVVIVLYIFLHLLRRGYKMVMGLADGKWINIGSLLKQAAESRRKNIELCQSPEQFQNLINSFDQDYRRYDVQLHSNQFREFLLQTYYDTLLMYMKNENYQGHELSDSFKRVLYSVYISNYSSCEYDDIERLFGFVSTVYKDVDVRNTDFEYIRGSIVLPIGLNALRDSNIVIVSKVLRLLNTTRAELLYKMRMFEGLLQDEFYSVLSIDFNECLRIYRGKYLPIVDISEIEKANIKRYVICIGCRLMLKFPISKTNVERGFKTIRVTMANLEKAKSYCLHSSNYKTAEAILDYCSKQNQDNQKK